MKIQIGKAVFWWLFIGFFAALSSSIFLQKDLTESLARFIFDSFGYVMFYFWCRFVWFIK